MDHSRRELSMFLPLLAGFGAQAATDSTLPSHVYNFNDLSAKRTWKTGAESRQVFTGTTHDGYSIDLHVSTMPPGEMPHPPHRHVHEEAFFVQRGSLEVTISGITSVVGPGSVAYIHSNEEHGLKSVGDIPAQYFVLALGNKSV